MIGLTIGVSSPHAPTLEGWTMTLATLCAGPWHLIEPRIAQRLRGSITLDRAWRPQAKGTLPARFKRIASEVIDSWQLMLI